MGFLLIFFTSFLYAQPARLTRKKRSIALKTSGKSRHLTDFTLLCYFIIVTRECKLVEAYVKKCPVFAQS